VIQIRVLLPTHIAIVRSRSDTRWPDDNDADGGVFFCVNPGCTAILARRLSRVFPWELPAAAIRLAREAWLGNIGVSGTLGRPSNIYTSAFGRKLFAAQAILRATSATE
jgi:hypothetical protein